MNYGFVIDNRSCIGCHACSTACKSENQVPLGVSRTWVKTVETGLFPDSTRHFQVTRCNHCANPPCVRICPVTAMYQRDDGIVEFDGSVCIGCKACIQACPYDAIYIDPETSTAAKCHYCAHRVETGLEPACVVVCPEHAIIAGDMDDPTSEISKILAKEKVTVRKPEQGTAPKLFYIEGEEVALTPTATPRTPPTFLTADVLSPHGDGAVLSAPQEPALAPAGSSLRSKSGAALRAPQPQGLPTAGPISIGHGTMAEQMVQVSYNAQHTIPWHWPVPAYLVTKGLSGGIFLLLSCAYLFGFVPFESKVFVAGGLFSLLMLAATGGLLLFDLDRPERFLNILLRPQWGSWLTRGAWIINAFAGVVTLWWGLETLALLGILAPSVPAAARSSLLVAGVPVSLALIVYTAFLFAQAEGRDLWQSTLLPVHLLVQAVMMGGAGIGLLQLFLPLPAALVTFGVRALVVSLIVDLFVVLVGEFGMPHASEVAARAARDITHGRYAVLFWVGAVLVGHGLPLCLLFVSQSPLSWCTAALTTIAGLYCFEHAYVMAPQEISNS